MKYANPGASDMVATAFVSTAVDFYCPQYAGM
jgi:hypothetical protein